MDHGPIRKERGAGHSVLAASLSKGEMTCRYVLACALFMATGALAVWNVGIAFVVGVTAYWLNKKGLLRI